MTEDIVLNRFIEMLGRDEERDGTHGYIVFACMFVQVVDYLCVSRRFNSICILIENEQ